MKTVQPQINWKERYLAEKDRRAHLESALAEMQEELDRLRRMRNSEEQRDLLATVSHEIRTPLNSIIGFTDLLAASEIEGDLRDHVDMIHTSGEALLLLVNDILDFSKLEAGKLTLVPGRFDPRALINEVAGVFQPQARTNGIRIDPDVAAKAPQRAFLDEGRVRQILFNLVSNAVKFTHEGCVTVRLMSPRDGWIRFEVEDSGIGIPEEKLDRLFKSFSQVDDTTQIKYGGTGLGLSICKQLVEMMGGTIGVESEAGRGSLFHFDVPRGDRQARSGDDDEGETWDPAAAAALRLLVVDDNLMNRRVITALLKHLGCSAELAVDGASAVEAARVGDFDLVLMDLELPDINGYEASRRILQFTPATTVIAVTGHAESDVAAECREAGMSGHLMKPVSPDRLKNMLARHGQQGAKLRDAEISCNLD